MEGEEEKGRGVAGHGEHRRVVTETVDLEWVDMMDPTGGTIWTS
jgi:hypothetical protein